MFLIYKKVNFHFFPTDLSLDLVGEQRSIYASTLCLLVYIHPDSPPLWEIVAQYLVPIYFCEAAHVLVGISLYILHPFAWLEMINSLEYFLKKQCDSNLQLYLEVKW